MKKTPIKRKCDALWSKIIRNQGYCAKCGSTQSLNAHHVIGRINHSLRYDLKNGVVLCSSCHKFSTTSAHNDPLHFLEWYKSEYPDNYDYLLANRNEQVKTSMEFYKQIYQELKEVERGL